MLQTKYRIVLSDNVIITIKFGIVRVVLDTIFETLLAQSTTESQVK